MTIQTPACEQLIIEIGITAAILAHLLNYLLSADTLHSTVGWVNLYKKFEIEKYTFCGKLILPKKWKGIF